MQFFEVIVERISYILQLQAYRPGMMSQLFAQIYRASCATLMSVIGSATILV